MGNSRSTIARTSRRGGSGRYAWTLPLLIGAIVLSGWVMRPTSGPPSRAQDVQLWEIRSVDTMKTSRDKARDKLADASYDAAIDKQLSAIRSLGANYVALGTPYDDEFIPYLTRWVKHARQHKLKVWFRGNFSRWEGWFEYPKDMTPDEHLTATASFIKKNPDLFEDGDIFDPCPECENAKYWPQPAANGQFNEFLMSQKTVTESSFRQIDRQVMSNVFSVIGGRAREVMAPQTAAALGNVVTIDHYIKDPKNMGEYIHYFATDLGARTLVGEYGAPIPDINGDITEVDQAAHVDAVLGELYKGRRDVYGINYYVLSEGTTALLNDDGTEREAAQVVKKYFSPAVITGTVSNTLGDALDGVVVATSDGFSTVETDKNGYYTLVVPAEPVQISFESAVHLPVVEIIDVQVGGRVSQNVVMNPLEKNFLYKLKLFLLGK